MCPPGSASAFAAGATHASSTRHRTAGRKRRTSAPIRPDVESATLAASAFFVQRFNKRAKSGITAIAVFTREFRRRRHDEAAQFLRPGRNDEHPCQPAPGDRSAPPSHEARPDGPRALPPAPHPALVLESPVSDSNRRPPPYHGGALPTELTGLVNRLYSPVSGGSRIRTCEGIAAWFTATSI